VSGAIRRRMLRPAAQRCACGGCNASCWKRDSFPQRVYLTSEPLSIRPIRSQRQPTRPPLSSLHGPSRVSSRTSLLPGTLPHTRQRGTQDLEATPITHNWTTFLALLGCTRLALHNCMNARRQRPTTNWVVDTAPSTRMHPMACDGHTLATGTWTAPLPTTATRSPTRRTWVRRALAHARAQNQKKITCSPAAPWSP